MNKKIYKKNLKNLKTFLLLFAVSTILLLIQILLINLNGAYYGNWYQKYISFLMDNSIYPKQKSVFFLFIVSVCLVIFYSIKILIFKLITKE